MPSVTILLLTIDRYEVTSKVITQALLNAGHPFTLHVHDNGSSDVAIQKWGLDQSRQYNGKYTRSESNIGTTQALNIMMRGTNSDYYVFIGNDIALPPGWLKAMVEYAEAIPNSGMVGINWRPLEYPAAVVNGKLTWPSKRIFGDVLFGKHVRQAIGELCEDYGPYGLWDSDTAVRCEMAGLLNYYIADLRSEHMTNDVGEDSDYRRMKDASLSTAKPIYSANVEQYKTTGLINLSYEKGYKETRPAWYGKDSGVDQPSGTGPEGLQGQVG